MRICDRCKSGNATTYRLLRPSGVVLFEFCDKCHVLYEDEMLRAMNAFFDSFSSPPEVKAEVEK